MTPILVFYSQFDSFEEWQALLSPLLPPNLRICQEQDIDDPDQVLYALAWKPPQGFFARYRNLRLLVNLGAGVDRWSAGTTYPTSPLPAYRTRTWAA